MFGRSITLFKLFGFEVRVDASWVIIAALVTWSLAGAIFPYAYPALPVSTYWWMGAAAAAGFFASIVLHELCHSLVARYYGLQMRGITLFIFGGVAEMTTEPLSPKVEFLMAIAGPLCSIALGGLFYGIRTALLGGSIEAVGIFAYLALINWLLAGFNLIPAFPLDGGRVLRSALWRWKKDPVRATAIASRIGSGFGILLMAFAVYEFFVGFFFGAVWYFFIGWFLRNASESSYQQTLLTSALSGEPVRRFMRPDPVTVPSGISVRQLVDNYLYRYDLKLYPVVNESEDLVGCVTTADVQNVAREEWDRRTVSEVAEPCNDKNTISPDTDALRALSKIREAGGAGLVVTERNHVLSVISPRDVMNFLAAKMELRGQSKTLFHAPRA